MRGLNVECPAGKTVGVEHTQAHPSDQTRGMGPPIHTERQLSGSLQPNTAAPAEIDISGNVLGDELDNRHSRRFAGRD